VRDVGEDPLVASVITRYPGAPWLEIGPGDDAAVLDLSRAPAGPPVAPGRRPPSATPPPAVGFPTAPVAGGYAGRVILCTDTLVEDQDFRRSWSGGHDVGVKVAAQNFADVAAMGGRPGSFVVSLVAPPDLPAAWVQDLADGVADECGRAGAVVAGGDVSAGREIVVTGTAFGLLDGDRAVRRSGARAGDVVAVAGVLGLAAAGLELLEAGLRDAEPLLVRSQLRPRPPYPAGPAAARAGATAMIDTSDGLLRDALRLARASATDLDLDRSVLRAGPELARAAALLGRADPDAWVLTGGEDHALLACFPPEAALPEGFRRIGSVRPAPAGGAVLLDGVPTHAAGGWTHLT
jgi:thiamine-monophosphate kinase